MAQQSESFIKADETHKEDTSFTNISSPSQRLSPRGSESTPRTSLSLLSPHRFSFSESASVSALSFPNSFEQSFHFPTTIDPYMQNTADVKLDKTIGSSCAQNDSNCNICAGHISISPTMDGNDTLSSVSSRRSSYCSGSPSTTPITKGSFTRANEDQKVNCGSTDCTNADYLFHCKAGDTTEQRQSFSPSPSFSLSQSEPSSSSPTACCARRKLQMSLDEENVAQATIPTIPGRKVPATLADSSPNSESTLSKPVDFQMQGATSSGSHKLSVPSGFYFRRGSSTGALLQGPGNLARGSDADNSFRATRQSSDFVSGIENGGLSSPVKTVV